MTSRSPPGLSASFVSVTGRLWGTRRASWQPDARATSAQPRLAGEPDRAAPPRALHVVDLTRRRGARRHRLLRGEYDRVRPGAGARAPRRRRLAHVAGPAAGARRAA